jgi:hypothetical protein
MIHCDAKAVLVEARRLIVEQGWCQGAYARTREGVVASRTEANAWQFCAYGALDRAGQDALYHARVDAALALQGAYDEVKEHGSALSGYNDAPWRVKEEIVALYDRAIAKVGGGDE